MTVSGMAVVNGSPMAGGAQPVGVNTRARVNRSVAQRDVVRRLRASRFAVSVYRTGTVVYCDAADSWLLNGASPSIRQVWRADYTARVPAEYRPFLLWCAAWRFPAVAVAATFDAAKWLLVHPVRGPLTLLAGVASTAAANL